MNPAQSIVKIVKIEKYRLLPFWLTAIFTILLGVGVPGQAQTGDTLYLPILVNDMAGSIPISCPIFPEDHIWNVPIDGLPLDPNSTAYINSIGAERTLHPDFGSGTWESFPIGIPYVIVPGTQPKVPVNFVYAQESDPGPYPIPPDPPVEGCLLYTSDAADECVNV